MCSSGQHRISTFLFLFLSRFCSKKLNKSNQGELSHEPATPVIDMSNAVALRGLKSFSVSDLRREDVAVSTTTTTKTPTTGGWIYKKASATATTTRENMKNLRPNSLLKIKVYSNIISQALNLNDTFLREREPKTQQPAKQASAAVSNHVVISSQNSSPPGLDAAGTGGIANAVTMATTTTPTPTPINPPVNVEQETHFKRRRTSL